ncbi:Peptidase family M28 [Tenacibaculum sp. MAR_2009_124]|uniref:M28 family peptidase n=1 Tax=Tenacibaculum sp. MAR_2009_124 TaxID=1250059 RepID=UPI0008944944|nr:M28 family peptidase [Tenacibaculum sp. MAR_2009_124]SEC01393.1 Peptidase family M28 [Tenacibaculum sp. MAR_2009_124]
MKKSNNLPAIFIIIISIFLSFHDSSPDIAYEKKLKKETNFSVDNALFHLKNISQKPHFTGSNEHKEVQKYIITALEKLGLKPEIQRQVAFNKKWKAGTTAENIVARIKGASGNNALLLLTHYDSNPHSSLGASDAGSGVVTILESLRAFLTNNEQPINDIVIVFSDAEEVGLLGAQAFVDHHPWAKDVKLVLNLEARGSGGPSIMLMETNGKNKRLVEEFIKSKSTFPVSSSLFYSIYKILPNDTDLTVFREDGNINGFNFAFIDDHFDYHTEQDSYERMDRNSLIHQADYMMTSLNHFANSDITTLNSEEDLVFVNFPLLKIISYPFNWILPMLIFSVVLFLVVYFAGARNQKITIVGSLTGFVPFTISLFVTGGVSFMLWKIILLIHPGYTDILHGFTYNGYLYIAAFSSLTIWILFKIYSYYKSIKPTDLFIAPIVFGILLNLVIFKYLPGAAFLIIPVLLAIFVLYIIVLMNLKRTSGLILFAIISIPSVYILIPLIKLFPVGLGLKILFVSSIFITFLFGWLIPILLKEQKKSYWQIIAGLATIALFTMTTFSSGFNVDNKKPNSLVFIENTDTKSSYWATYNNTIDSYTKQIFNENYTEGNLPETSGKSKYNTPFKYHKLAKYQNLPNSKISVILDTIIENNREINFTIIPQRKINKYEIYTSNPLEIKGICLNGESYDYETPLKIKQGSVLTYQMANFDTEVSVLLKLPKDSKLELTLNEISYDLLTNPAFNLESRNETMMPMPFVTNDAIITSKELKF